MKKDLSDYVKQYKSFLKEDICDKTILELNKLNSNLWNQHTFFNIVKNTSVKLSGDQELSTLYSKEISTKEIIMKELWTAIYNYIIDFKFSWFSGWKSYSEIRFNKYSENTKMAEHCDHIHSLFDGTEKGIPILSVLGILNDDYKGGEFIMFEKEEIKLNKGDLLIFPSIFLYPHKVEPITKGTRYSFISWVW
jgi:predicted 2-oxoglutarate/Fe(II)-dependent dioxygenase YbiX